ncbi:succinyl-diaminopimelate desuccinylase [Enterovirga aerilata]|uniref:Succinyl-diaminopimelate desuccinylase n=1 Tax=Enterovirga aerilata TaxID=2730920 RepID=A0A849ICJ3_9HYPH|nr:succinyl-diaminopimelate desuccinylase [Enterovirga sp. DB1703]NNM73965.1 succinyl-diaminopimelate desuccinylase [Enterovirga sp. DB1703]
MQPAPETALAIAQALIRCPSVTPEDAGALTYVAGLLERAGFEVHTPAFSEPGQPEIRNLYARIGRGAPCLVFAGHTDVVPPGQEGSWTHPPFAGEVADGRLYGRGAADMKGGIAAMLAAALAHLDRHGPPAEGSLAFLLTGDEEGPAVNGTVKLLAWAKERGERFDHCVLGEPTNPNRLGEMMKIGRRGSLTGRLAVKGRQGHVAYPHLALNPIPVLGRVIAALTDPPLDRGTERFDASNLEFTTVDVANPATNVIPAEAKAVFNIRFNDLWTPETLAAEIGRRVATACEEARFALTFDPTNAVAFVTEPDDFVHLVSGAIRAETGLSPELSTTGGTSDARFIRRYCPVVEFGLVGQTMHAVDENVAVRDLESLARIYGRIIESYLPPRNSRGTCA